MSCKIAVKTILSYLGRKDSSQKLIDTIANDEWFNNAIEKMKVEPVSATLEALDRAKQLIGSCPKCGGRTHGLGGGPHFDGVRVCNICEWVSD